MYLKPFGLPKQPHEGPRIYTPLSICSGMSVAVNALQSRQV